MSRVLRLLVPHAPIAAVMACAGVLLFWRLGAVYLWQDEAATAVMAERMLAYGKPLAYDGRNLITMDSFVDEDRATIDKRTGSAEEALRYLVARGDFRADTTWVGQPWGQFAAAAISLGLLGHGTVQARLPFALAALATVLLVYLLARRVFENSGTAVLAAALLAANAFWILESRQCRYYALSSLALLLSVAAFLRWQRGDRWGARLFVLAGWIYFQCDFGSFFPSMAILAVAAGAASWPRIGRPAAVFAALGLTVAPFAWYYGIHERLRNPSSTLETRIRGNLLNVNSFVIAFAVLVLAAWLLWRRKPEPSREQRLLLWVSVGIILSTLVWVPMVAPAAFQRYVVQLTPLAVLVTAWVATRMADAVAAKAGGPWLRPWVLVVAGVIEAGTRVTSLPGLMALTVAWGGLRPSSWLLRPELAVAVRDVFHPIPDPNRLVIEAIGPWLRPGDEILVNYEDIPLMFYTGAGVRGGVAAFRVEDHQAPPPRFLVLRRSVPFVHWTVFRREVSRYQWRPISTGAPDVVWGNFVDPTYSRPADPPEVIVAERVTP